MNLDDLQLVATGFVPEKLRLAIKPSPDFPVYLSVTTVAIEGHDGVGYAVLVCGPVLSHLPGQPPVHRGPE